MTLTLRIETSRRLQDNWIEGINCLNNLLCTAIYLTWLRPGSVGIHWWIKLNLEIWVELSKDNFNVWKWAVKISEFLACAGKIFRYLSMLSGILSYWCTISCSSTMLNTNYVLQLSTKGSISWISLYWGNIKVFGQGWGNLSIFFSVISPRVKLGGPGLVRET